MGGFLPSSFRVYFAISLYYSMMDTAVPHSSLLSRILLRILYFFEKDISLLKNDIRSIYQPFKTMALLHQLKNLTSL